MQPIPFFVSRPHQKRIYVACVLDYIEDLFCTLSDCSSGSVKRFANAVGIEIV
jgi:hypothetical protein